ncbi:MAG: signal transduction histidine kinase [Kiritimatiellia bacterium]|jgi:signal transduction histidine kinase
MTAGSDRVLYLTLIAGAVLLALGGNLFAGLTVIAGAEQDWSRVEQASMTATAHELASNVAALRGAVRSIATQGPLSSAGLAQQGQALGGPLSRSRLIIRDSSGILVDTEAGTPHPPHIHHSDMGYHPCDRCIGGGHLVMAGPRRFGGRWAVAILSVAHVTPALEHSQGWLVDDHRQTIMRGPGTTYAAPTSLQNSWFPWDRLLIAEAPVPVNGLNWSMVAAVPARSALSNVHGTLLALGAVGAGIIALIALLTGWMVTRDRNAYREHLAAQQERLTLLDAVAHADRLATLGTLTAGVAHDLRGPLTALQLLTSIIEDCDVDDEIISDMRESTRLLSGIADGLTRFAREGSGPDVCDPAEAVEVMARLLDRTSASQVVMELQTGIIAPLSRQRLVQLLLNLAHNAHQAGAHRLHFSVRAQHDQVVIELHDDGPGLPEGLNVFDPFVTTKPAGEGTGLGLYLCRKFVNDAGGQLHSGRSERLGGAWFRIELGLVQPGYTDESHDIGQRRAV